MVVILNFLKKNFFIISIIFFIFWFVGLGFTHEYLMSKLIFEQNSLNYDHIFMQKVLHTIDDKGNSELNIYLKKFVENPDGEVVYY